jgi:hypothetical protein
MSSKQRLPPRLDIGYPPLKRKNTREAPECEDASREKDESPDGESEGRVGPRFERHRRAEIDKDGAVGEEVNRRREVGFFDGFGEPVKREGVCESSQAEEGMGAYQSSQAKAVPHANAARRSSDPASVVRPVTSNANATYMATCSSQLYQLALHAALNPSTQRAHSPYSRDQ